MKIVGLTGGIGSGKTTVTELFKNLGVPIYIADIEAKRLMVEDEELKTSICALLGDEAYLDGILNRTWIASKVFEDKKLLNQLNNLVHPAVSNDFIAWTSLQDSVYVIKEVAILFETGGEQYCDITILVTAPEEERISRVVKRDGVSREQVMMRLQHQWNDEKKMKYADFVIMNTDLEYTKEQVKGIHKRLVITGGPKGSGEFC